MRIIELEQGTEEWFRVRMGMPTASEFATVMAKGKGDSDSKMRRTYMRKLAGEILTGQPMESYSNDHMKRGTEMEPQARDTYSFIHDIEPQQVGFVLRNSGETGCSPDSLIGDNGMLEIKTKLPHLAIECLEADVFPAEHRAQCQGALWIVEREWIDIVVYWPGIPLFIKRAYRDETYIKQIEGAVNQFNEELDALVDRIQRMGGSEVRAAA